MELVYYYATGYNSLSSRGINLSNKYIVEYSIESKKLSVDLNEDHFPNFFGKNIDSVTAIIGGNGAGKTTMLKTISRTVVFDNQVDKNGEFDFFAVYCIKDQLYYYVLGDIEINPVGSNLKRASKEQWIDALRSFTTVFFSQHLENLYSENLFDRKDDEKIRGKIDLSTTYLYRLLTTKKSSNPGQVSSRFRKEENRKYLKLFKNVDLKVEGLKLPGFIVINIFKGTRIRMDSVYKNWSVDAYLELFDSQNSLTDSVYKALIIEILNQLFEYYKSGKTDTELLHFFDNLTLLSRKQREYSEDYIKVISELTEIFPSKRKELAVAVLKLSQFLSKILELKGEFGYENVYFNIKSTNLKELLIELDHGGLFEDALDFIDVGYTHSPNHHATFSSGEYAILGLFSRIFDKQNKLSENNIIFLDEAEICLHPKWQRMFVNVLLDFLSNNFGKKRFQIVFASHSPVILSDIPHWAVTNFSLERNNLNETIETFGANIHELFSRSFALDGLLIGEFAAGKIKKYVELVFEKGRRLSEEENFEVRQFLKLLGEPFIKEKLIEQLSVNLSESDIIEREIRLREQEIEMLKLRIQKRNDQNRN